MDTILQSPAALVAIIDGFASKAETWIAMHCHDKLFKNVTVVNEAGEKLFTIESKAFESWTWRRSIKDASSGHHLCDLREVMDNGTRHKWIIESPDGQEICSLRHPSLLNRLILDVKVKNAEVEADEMKGTHEEAMVQVRPQDQGGITTLVNIHGATAAEIRLLESNYYANGRDRSVWKGRVASGVDLVLIVAIMLVRAEVLHTAWKDMPRY